MAKTKNETKAEAPKAETTVLESLLGKRGDDPESDLDCEQCNRLLHLLRASGGEHGAALADKLAEPAKSGKKGEPKSEGTEVD